MALALPLPNGIRMYSGHVTTYSCNGLLIRRMRGAVSYLASHLNVESVSHVGSDPDSAFYGFFNIAVAGPEVLTRYLRL